MRTFSAVMFGAALAAGAMNASAQTFPVKPVTPR